MERALERGLKGAWKGLETSLKRAGHGDCKWRWNGANRGAAKGDSKGAGNGGCKAAGKRLETRAGKVRGKGGGQGLILDLKARLESDWKGRWKEA